MLENVQFEHLGTPMTLKPSKEDYFRSLRGGHTKQFYHEKSSFDSGSSSYWSPAQNQFQSTYNTNPMIPQHESFMKSVPVDPFGNRLILIILWILV